MCLFILYFRRNKVSKATKLAWPGNDLPIFRGNKENIKKPDDLVKELIPTCSSKFFTVASIRQHIIDTLAERRQQVKKGYDYNMVSKDLNVTTCIERIQLLL